jgi:hypothetical protein
MKTTKQNCPTSFECLSDELQLEVVRNDLANFSANVKHFVSLFDLASNAHWFDYDATFCKTRDMCVARPEILR